MANAAIYGQVNPIKSVAEYANEMNAADAMAGRNALQQVALGRARDEAAAQATARNALQRLASGWNADTTVDQRIGALRNSGVPELMQQADALEKQALDKRKTDAEALGKDVETENKVIAVYRDAIGMATDPQSAATYVQLMHSDPRLQNTAIARVPLDLALSQIGRDPASFDRWKQQFALGAAKFVEQNRPQYITQNLGGTSRIVAAPGLGGPTTVATEAPVTQSADNRATVGAQMANAAAMRDQAQATRDAATIQTGFRNEQELRKEFEALPEIKNYKMAYPSYAAIRDATTRSTPQADINIVYGIAKLYDPTSVVREGEYATVANSPNIPERIKGYAQYIAGGGKLSEQTKREILAEATSRIGTYKAEAEKARASYEGIAKGRGMNPSNVFQRMGDIGGGVIDWGALK